MPDLPNRSEKEQMFAGALQRVYGRAREELVRMLGNPPDINRIPDSFWQELQEQQEQEIAAGIIIVFLLASDGIESTSGHRIDKSDARTQAFQYAATRAQAVAADSTQNARNRLYAEIEAWKASRGDLRTAVDSALPDSRADTIAATETTASVSAGENWANDELTDLGITVETFWVTEKDANVCPVCAPLDEKPQAIYDIYVPGGPPAHPRCRCFLRSVYH